MTLFDRLHENVEDDKALSFLQELSSLEDLLQSSGSPKDELDNNVVLNAVGYCYGTKVADPELREDEERERVSKGIIQEGSHVVQAGYGKYLNDLLIGLPEVVHNLTPQNARKWVNIGVGKESLGDVLGQDYMKEVGEFTPEDYFSFHAESTGWGVFEQLYEEQREQSVMEISGRDVVTEGERIKCEEAPLPPPLRPVAARPSGAPIVSSPPEPAVAMPSAERTTVGVGIPPLPTPGKVPAPSPFTPPGPLDRTYTPSELPFTVPPHLMGPSPGKGARPAVAPPSAPRSSTSPPPAQTEERRSPDSLEQLFYSRVLGGLTTTQGNLPRVQEDVLKYSRNIVQHLVPYRGRKVLEHIERTSKYLRTVDGNFPLPFLSSAEQLYDRLEPKHVDAFIKRGLELKIWQDFQQQRLRKDKPKSGEEILYSDAYGKVERWLALQSEEGRTAFREEIQRQGKTYRHSRWLGWGVAAVATTAAVLSTALWLFSPSYKIPQLEKERTTLQQQLAAAQEHGRKLETSITRLAAFYENLYGSKLEACAAMKDLPKRKECSRGVAENYLAAFPDPEGGIGVRARNCNDALRNLHWVMTHGFFPETLTPFIGDLLNSPYCSAEDDAWMKETAETTYVRFMYQNKKGEKSTK